MTKRYSEEEVQVLVSRAINVYNQESFGLDDSPQLKLVAHGMVIRDVPYLEYRVGDQTFRLSITKVG